MTPCIAYYRSAIVNVEADRPDPRPAGPESRLVVIVAASIPPVQGQALVAQRVGMLVSSAGHETHFVSRNPQQLHRGIGYYASLLVGLLRALRKSFALRGRRRAPKTVYVTSSGGLGILAEGLCVALLLRRTDRLVVHHHSFAYLNKPTLAFRAVSRSVYRRAFHVVLCEHMAALLGAHVASKRISIVSNAAFVDTPGKAQNSEPIESAGLRLGHLSNLAVEKGLDLVLGVLSDTPDDVSLTIYGSPIDGQSATLLREALETFPSRLTHIEPTNREGVWDFFRSIDLFLFPSRYRNEAAPLVVLEALSAGVPVVASDRGCIPSQLAPELDDFVTTIEQFPSKINVIVREMLSEHDYKHEAVRRAERQWTQLEAASRLHVSELLTLVLAEDGR